MMLAQLELNWTAIGVIAGGCISIVTIIIIPVMRRAIGSVMGEIIKREVTWRFDKVDVDLTDIRLHITNIDTRVARLEGIEEGRRALLDQQKLGDGK